MKAINFFRVITLATVFACLAMLSASCEKGPEHVCPTDTSVICGTVKDTFGNLMEDVEVSVWESNTSTEALATAKTSYDGTYSLKVDAAKVGYVSFVKAGFSKVGISVTPASFKDDVLFANPVLEFAQGKITGRVLNALEGNIPFNGASVNNGAETVTTGEDGVYTFENLTLQDYTLTITATGCATVTKKVSVDDFDENGTVTLEDISLGGVDVLPGRSAQDLKNAPKWFINEYRAGFGLGGDGSGSDDDYGNATMSLMSGQFFEWVGLYEMQNEGCTLQIVDGNNETSGLKADLTKFDSYTYGSKEITEDNKILSIYWRTHHGTSDNQVPWGVMVVDLSAAEPEAVFVQEMDLKENIVYGTDSDWHTNYFDLSDYVGKEVIIAIGDFRRVDNKCWYQFVLTHISFGPEKVEGHKALGLYGTPIAGLEGWRMNLEMVKSTMSNPRTSFNASKGDLKWEPNPCFGVWRNTGHIASEWGLQYVSCTCTPDCGEGFMLQTRNTEEPLNSEKPESYFYSKFSISGANDQMTFYTRNFSSTDPTYFRVTVIEEDGTVTALAPVSNTAAQAEAVENGVWKFIHENGWSGDLANCAKFVYDLSAFDGKDVMVTIGIHRCGGEKKLVFCGVDFE